MRRGDLLLSIVLLLGLGALAYRLAPVPETRTGTPRIVDGDTMELGGRRLRLAGMDAPEMAQLCTRDGQTYRCGLVARDALAARLGRGPLACRILGRDRYDRDLATCAVAGEDVGASLVRMGIAVSYGRYLAEERSARREGVGLWAGSFERPAEWRRAHEAGATGSLR